MASKDALDARFAALADPTRRGIVERLTRGEATVGELAHPFDISLPAISRHVSVLERAGIVKRWRDGKSQRCRLQPQALATASTWLDRTQRDWDKRLDRLERMFEEDKE